MTPEQCRTARELLGWSRQDLASMASISSDTVKKFEESARQPFASTGTALCRTLEAAGAEFSTGRRGRAGVRLRKARAHAA